MEEKGAGSGEGEERSREPGGLDGQRRKKRNGSEGTCLNREKDRPVRG